MCSGPWCVDGGGKAGNASQPAQSAKIAKVAAHLLPIRVFVASHDGFFGPRHHKSACIPGGTLSGCGSICDPPGLFLFLAGRREISASRPGTDPCLWPRFRRLSRSQRPRVFQPALARGNLAHYTSPPRMPKARPTSSPDERCGFNRLGGDPVAARPVLRLSSTIWGALTRISSDLGIRQAPGLRLFASRNYCNWTRAF